MPTGYTSDLYDGKDVPFEEFVMGCARAFGALVTMRDAPRDAEIPQCFEPSSYYAKALQEARDRLAEVGAWSDKDADREAEAAHQESVRRYDAEKAKRVELRGRYEAMLAKVEAWEPPSEDHQALKTFMADQLRSSIDNDCDMTYWPVADRLSGKDFKHRELVEARTRIRRLEESLADGERRAGERTAWVQALRESLEGAPSVV